MCKKRYNRSDNTLHSIDVILHYNGTHPDKIYARMILPIHIDFYCGINSKIFLCDECNSNISAIKFPSNDWGLVLRLCYIKKIKTEGAYKLGISGGNRAKIIFTLRENCNRKDEQFYQGAIEFDLPKKSIPFCLNSIITESLMDSGVSNIINMNIDVTDIINNELDKLERVN